MIKIEQMIQTSKANCVGCYGCYNICPQNAITMKEDTEGFFYPVIQREQCIQCEACSRVCPVSNSAVNTNDSEPETYAAINEDWTVRRESSSGGIFQLIAEPILQQGGVVFGAGFDEEWGVVHQAVQDKNELAKLRTSKYVQSRIENTYSNVKKILESGRQALFVGTPCQCIALKRYLTKEYTNLTLVDFICHGVPSPAVWRQYCTWRTCGKEIERISFRNKYLAKDLEHDLYLKGFLQNLYLRPSCHQCKFCRKHRPTDLTLADFWGVQEELPEMYDGKGTSLVFIHSKKGQKIFESLKAKKKKTTFAKAIKYNPSMVQPAIPSPNRKQFFQEFVAGKIPIHELIYKNLQKPSIKQRIKGALRQVPGVVWVYKALRGK